MKHCLLKLFILFFLGMFSGCDSKQTGHFGIKFSSNNLSNQWDCKFYYLDGGIKGNFTAKKDDAQLVYSSAIENGTVDFQLYNSKDSLLVIIPTNNNADTISGIFEKGQQYKVRATAKQAKGRFNFKME